MAGKIAIGKGISIDFSNTDFDEEGNFFAKIGNLDSDFPGNGQLGTLSRIEG